MAITLTTCKTQLALRLQDTGNLIYSASLLEEALRSSLSEITSAYGAAQTLNGLDGETETTFDDVDLHTFLVGGEAYALRTRLIAKLDEANPAREDLKDTAQAAQDKMTEFQALLSHIRLRRFQESTDHPYSQWEWDEGEDFS